MCISAPRTRPSNPPRRLLPFVLVAALWPLPALPAGAHETESRSNPNSEEEARVAEPSGPALTPTGSMIFVSPETGELVSAPAAGQMERLLALGRALAARRAAQSAEGDGKEPAPELFQTPVGVGLRLDDRFLHALTVRFDEDGKAHWACTTAGHIHSAGAGDQPVEAPES